MGNRMKKSSIVKFLLLSLTVMFIGSFAAGAVNAQTIYWADPSNPTQALTTIENISVGESKTIRLMGGIPTTGDELRAFSLDVTIPTNVTIIEDSVVVDPTNLFDVENKSIANSTLSINGYNVAEQGETPITESPVALADVTFTGTALGTVDLAIDPDTIKYGESSDNQFLSDPPAAGEIVQVPSDFQVAPIAEDNYEIYWTDAATGARVDTFSVGVGETASVILMGEVPADLTLRAFSLDLDYPEGIIAIDSTSFNLDNGFPCGATQDQCNENIDTATGEIQINGFAEAAAGSDLTNVGVSGGTTGTTVALYKVTFQGTTAGGPSSLTIDPTAGEVSYGNLENFANPPTMIPLNISAFECADTSFTVATTYLTATFTITNPVAGLNYTFDFGDNATSDAASASNPTVSHTYNAGATYDVVLTVENPDKNCIVSSTPKPVTVTEEPYIPPTPVCSAEAIFTAQVEGLKVTLDTTGSFGTLSFDYGDNQTGTELTHTYAAPGTYTITLTATDPSVDNCVDTHSVTVNPTKPEPEQNVVYWTDPTGEGALTQLLLNSDEEKTIRLNAEVPAGETLKVYEFTLIYDPNVVEIVSAVGTPGSSLPAIQPNIETNTIAVNAFTTDGVQGPATVGIVDVTLKGGQVGVFDFGVTSDIFNDGTNEFKPSYANPLTVTVPSEPVYTVNASVEGAGGTVAPSGETQVQNGESFTLTITPEQEYAADTITVNGQPASPTGINSYVIPSVTSDMTIVVTFKLSPIENRPNPPALVSPNNGDSDVSLTGTLQTGPYSDPDGNAHAFTQWQISSNGNFDDADIVHEETSDEDLTSLKLPSWLVLDPNTTYYWRARFVDAAGSVSEWSPVNTFSTVVTDPIDQNGDGVPDDQEWPDAPTVDPLVLYIQSAEGSGVISVAGVNNVSEMNKVIAVQSDDVDFPDNIQTPLGLFGFKLTTTAPGEFARVQATFTPNAPEGSIYYLYNRETGIFEPVQDVIQAGGNSAIFEIKDGGPFDADGIENGVIIVSATGFGVVSDCDAVATFRAVPMEGEEPLTVMLDATGSTGALMWDFGDNTTKGAGMITFHTYETAGDFTVTLTVKAENGCTISASKTIEVTEAGAPPVVDSGSDDNCFVTSLAGTSSFGGMIPALLLLISGVAIAAGRKR